MIDIEYRPWGWFKVLQRGDDYCVKELFVESDKRISLQFHRHRTEDWIVVQGSGIITQGNLEVDADVGSTFFIPIEQRHRIKGGENGIRIIEVQRGKCFEDDIVRLQDDFNRLDDYAWRNFG